ncbi:Sister chromatid cohesion protein PDS5 [Candida viswanathii]|uniref:Sister chromatid cohesion protein PDS5 n=1 Tax=Candida viswanathii TaxID=5486 RepID=A0A367YNX0_9ASCO|nr:Sister chromatid cohesion protein PDS5 [Candida viswanathii]
MVTRNESESSSSIKFDKPIIPTVKAPISNKELINRLVCLHDELSNIDDSSVDLSSYTASLVNKKLLSHSSVGVQAYLCCCLSDILRIFAPNAPYSAQQLSDIFKLFFKQFARLTDKKDDPFYQQHVYLLKRLAEAKSTILITDLPDLETLIVSIFNTFYNLALKGFPSELETIITDILSEVLSEAEVVPHEVLQLILQKIANHDPSKLLLNNISSPEFNFSLAICENNMDRMSRLVAQYFSEILYESTNAIDEDSEIEDEDAAAAAATRKSKASGLSKAMEVLKKVHHLSIQLWKFIPSVLSSVMALIDDELNADDDKVRILATVTIGQMLGAPTYPSVSTKVNFFITHKQVWNNWLKKTADVSASVRSKWVQQLPRIISCNTNLTTEINQMLSTCLHKCLVDTDERVREAATVAISEIPYLQFVSKLATPEIMKTLFQLIREKHSGIRQTSVEILSSTYSKNMKAESSADISEQLQTLITSIPNQLLSLVYINNKNITSLVDVSVFDTLLEVSEPNTTKRVERLVRFYSGLDDKGVEAFVAINKRQQQLSKVLLTFIESAEEYNRGSTSEDKENGSVDDQKEIILKLDKIIDWICVSFPDGLNTALCLERFYKLNRIRFFNLVKVCISSDSDFNTIRNSMKELLNKLGDAKNIRLENEKFGITTTEMCETFKLLLLRASPLIYNRSNIEDLINYSKDSSNEYYTAANALLEQISSIIPDVFKSHLRSLTNLVVDQRDQIINKSNALKTIYHFVKKYPDSFPKEISFMEALKKLATQGNSSEAKYAIKTIGLSDKKEVACSGIVKFIYPLTVDDDKFATHLSSIAEIFVVDRLAILDMENELTPLLIKKVLLSNRSLDRDSTEGNEWISDDDVEKHPCLNEKLIAIRLLVNNLKSLDKENMSDDAIEEAKQKALPVIKLLMSLIGNNGEIINKKDKSWPTPDSYKLRLRLAAGLYMLKLAKIPIYSETMLLASIRRLTFLVNNEDYHVRAGFIKSLQKKLYDELISEKFLSIVFFSALEQNQELKNDSTMWITAMFKRLESKKDIKFEKTLVRLIHTLAHHEQFLEIIKDGNDESKLAAFNYASRFLTFYVQLIATQDNISLLYYFASRVKQHRDATIATADYEAEEPTQQILNLYRVAELAQLVIKTFADGKNWPMQTWPGKISLPLDIFAPMASSKEAQWVVTQIFIPEAQQVELANTINKRLRNVSSVKKVGESVKTRQKRTKPVSARSLAKKKKAKIVKEKVNTEPTRKSARSTSKVSYKDQLESDEEEEVELDDDLNDSDEFDV